MKIPLYQVDAFASRVFGGNPAAVCPLRRWLPDATLQAIAAENNLSETAFVVEEAQGFGLRWFTPAAEVDLCGHATLASGFVYLNHVYPELNSITFETRSGPLTVTRDGDLFQLELPSRPPSALPHSPDLEAALGHRPSTLLAARDWLAVFDTEAEIRSLKPDMAALAKLPTFGVIVTAPGEWVDFVSRFFAPANGVPEDPVTGSAHSTLTPYWAQRLGKRRLFAKQISRRGGDLHCECIDGRVRLLGEARLYLTGTISLD